MQKFVMFDKVSETATIQYADGTIKTKAEVKGDYPILNTPLGVIGITTDNAGTVGEFIIMGYYDNVFSFKDTYVSQGAPVTDEMSYDEICECITEFVNNPVSEEDEALEAYLNL